ncbi:MAG: deacylase [Phycisphaeraceae bacterium]|nr:deacylase [Phycisphaeraceae bacterium]
MPMQKLRKFLDENGVKYVTMSHSPAYTAQEIAAAAHVPGRELAKTVMVKIDGRMAMVVLPATQKIDFEVLREATGVDHVELASEREFADRFPDCELGAMPPFGNLFDMDVYVAETLTDDEEIAFNAGAHTELIKVYFVDFERLVRPSIIAATRAR